MSVYRIKWCFGFDWKCSTRRRFNKWVVVTMRSARRVFRKRPTLSSWKSKHHSWFHRNSQHYLGGGKCNDCAQSGGKNLRPKYEFTTMILLSYTWRSVIEEAGNGPWAWLHPSLRQLTKCSYGYTSQCYTLVTYVYRTNGSLT